MFIYINTFTTSRLAGIFSHGAHNADLSLQLLWQQKREESRKSRSKFSSSRWVLIFPSSPPTQLHPCLFAASVCSPHVRRWRSWRWLFVGFIDAAFQRAAILFPFVKLVISFRPPLTLNALVQSGFISGCFYCLPNVCAILRHCFFFFLFFSTGKD